MPIEREPGHGSLTLIEFAKRGAPPDWPEPEVLEERTEHALVITPEEYTVAISLLACIAIVLVVVVLIV